MESVRLSRRVHWNTSLSTTRTNRDQPHQQHIVRPYIVRVIDVTQDLRDLALHGFPIQILRTPTIKRIQSGWGAQFLCAELITWCARRRGRTRSANTMQNLPRIRWSWLYLARRQRLPVGR
jgi:hypothetical protein